MTTNRLSSFSANGQNHAATPNLTLRCLREEAALLGIGGVDQITSRYRLLDAINGKRAEIEQLRAECVRLGLPVEGDEAALRLRLVQTQPGAVSQDMRRLYRRMGLASVLLAVAGLAVSLPHLAAGLGSITGVGLLYSILLALVIDCGFVSLKVIDTLARTFQLSRVVRGGVWGLMAVCLGFSAAVNACEFLRTADSPALAIVTATFLAVFIVCMSMIGSALLTRCEPRTVPTEERPSTIFRRAANHYDRLGRLAGDFADD